MPIGPQYVGDTELPWPEGDHAGPAVYHGDVAPFTGAARWTLTGMAADYRFYSAAALLAAGIPRDPAEVYWAEAGLPAAEAPRAVDLGRVVLRGLVPPADRVVWACPRRHAEGLFTALARVGCVDHSTGDRWDSAHQRLPLVDWPLALSLTHPPAAPPTVDVELFGLVGQKGGFLWWRPADLWKNPLSLTWQPTPPPPPVRPFPFRPRAGRRPTGTGR